MTTKKKKVESTNDTPSESKSSKKEQLHVSMLNMASRCWPQFVFRWGAIFKIWPECEIVAPGANTLVGRATHRGVEHINNDLIKNAIDNVEKYIEIARKHFKGEWSQGVHLLTTDKPKIVQSQSIDLAGNLVASYNEKVVGSFTPKKVEQPFVIKTKDFPFDLAGRIDLITTQDHIRDLKTSGMYPAADAARSLQMSMYALSRYLAKETMPGVVALDYMYYSRTKAGHNIHYHIRQETPKLDWIKPLYHRIEQMADILDRCSRGLTDPMKAAPAADPSSWVCTAKYCGYAKKCRFWSRRIS